MMQNGTLTQTSVIPSSSKGRSKTHTAIRNGMSHSTKRNRDEKHFGKSNGDEKGNGNGHHDCSEDIDGETTTGFISFLEFIFVSLYKCFGVGLHAGLAISFLAIVAVWILASFHDRYFVTILTRARRTDDDLLKEITYYQRRCDVSDVTTSDSHHIHFGEVDDNASEIFIDVDKIWREEAESDFFNQTDVYYDQQGFRTHYQRETLPRRRRNFAFKFNMWEHPELRPIPKNVAEKAGNQAVDAMMKHGSVMIPQILGEATIERLREFIEKKNHAVLGTSDEYPMTGNHRISYGIESTEDPSVVQALKEIHNHGVFAHLIQNLVGDENPALTEITAITSWHGAEDQNWHADIKPDGNGVKFGRTYSHSYSLFLPLQKTTKSMGATDVCPGTHMCADEDLSDICEEKGVSASDVRRARPRSEYSPDQYGEAKYRQDLQLEGYWRAGDGMLLNQMNWHRGGGFDAPDEPDRIMFIVSFIKRPNSDDPRQLARGTYFHQKWLNWGSTWDDMVDTMAHLQRPWNILRCLHLYKASDRSWGYDLFYATSLRIANGQMGGEPYDLEALIDNVITPLNFPKWLQGDLDFEDERAWSIYLSGTLNKTLYFLYDVNIYGHIGLVGFLAFASISGYLFSKLRAKKSPNVVGDVLKSGAKRLLLTHSLVLVLGFYVWRVKICSSQWAIDLDSGKTLMRPFPEPLFRENDPGVLGIESTLPRRSDVLINTRMNTKTIGMYKTYFEYHPANRLLDQFVGAYGGIGGFYHSLLPKNAANQTISQLPSDLSHQLVKTAFDMITKHHGGGRFLMQDYRTGYWYVLSEADSIAYIRRRLLIGDKYSTALGAIQDEIDELLDKQRFGASRNSLSMSWNSQLFLHDISKEITSTNVEKETKENGKVKMAMSPVSSASNHITLPQSVFRLREWESIGPTVSSANDDEGNRKFLIGKGSLAFRPGMEIWLIMKDLDNNVELIRGTMVQINYKKRYKDRYCRYQITLEDEAVVELERTELSYVSRAVLKPRTPITSGDRITAEIEEGEYFDGTIQLVTADGSVDVEFDDGDSVGGIGLSEYVPLEAIP